MKIAGKVAIVTGGASGIGRAAAEALARKQAKGILIVDIDLQAAQQLADEIEAASKTQSLALGLDLSQTEAIETMYEEALNAFGSVDIVFNNAGRVSGPPPFPATPLERIRQVIDLDLTAVVQSTALALSNMAKTGGGIIVNTASTGAVNPLPADAAYAAAKAGVAHLSASCAAFADELNVRVVAIGPGVTDTPILEQTGGGKRPDWLQPVLQAIQILTPEEVAQRFIDIVEDDTIVGELILIENVPTGVNPTTL